jgi:hypothetical protein
MSLLHIPARTPIYEKPNRLFCSWYRSRVRNRGCATYSKVSEKRPRYNSAAGESGAMATAETKIIKALRVDRGDPLVALGEYMTAAEIASDQLERNPDDVNAMHDYNFAVARIIAVIRDAKLDPWTQPLRVPASGGVFLLTHRPDPRPQWNPALYTFTPADQFDVHGTYVTERTTRAGLGAPVVAVGREVNKDARANFSLPRVYYGVTAIARFDNRRCMLSFEDPLAEETVQVNGHSYALAADFTVPLAVLLASTNPKKLELSRLLNPAKYAETARISRLQPYDPNKAVVLVIHGLMDSPATWTPMLNGLRGDADIRRNYQFWFYSYPSGYAILTPLRSCGANLTPQRNAFRSASRRLSSATVWAAASAGCSSPTPGTSSGWNYSTSLRNRRHFLLEPGRYIPKPSSSGTAQKSDA